MKRIVSRGLVLALVVCLASLTPIMAGERYWKGGWSTLEEYQMDTGQKIEKFSEAPELRVKVAAGELPPVQQRLPEEPKVLDPLEEIGQYGGQWREVWKGVTQPWPITRSQEEKLIQFTFRGDELVPNLSKSWEISEEGRVFTFHLRKGVKWSDGAPFTADDVLYHFEDEILNEEIVPGFPGWLTIDGEPVKLEKVDSYTVRFTFAKANPLFLMVFAWRNEEFYAPKHYRKQFHPRYTAAEELEKMAKKNGFSNWQELYRAKCDLTWGKWSIVNPEHPTLRAWKVTKEPGAIRTTFARNPYYWKVDPQGNQLPYIGEIVWDQVLDEQMITQNAIMGKVDYETWMMEEVDWPLFKEYEEKGDYRALEYEDTNCTKALIMPNYDTDDLVLRDLFHNAEFRKALSLAINRDEVNQLVYDGLGNPMQAAIPPGSPYYSEEWATAYVEYNPKEANRLLDEIGLDKRNKEGWRLRSDGDVLTLHIESITGPERVKPLELVTDYWNKVGIKTTLKVIQRTLWETRAMANEIDIITWDSFGGAFPNFLLDANLFVPNGEVQPITPWKEYSRWYASGGKEGREPPPKIRELQQLYAKAISAVDPEERNGYAREIVNLHKENIWLIGVVSQIPYLVIAKNHMRNVPEVAPSNGWMPRNNAIQLFFIKK